MCRICELSEEILDLLDGELADVGCNALSNCLIQISAVYGMSREQALEVFGAQWDAITKRLAERRGEHGGLHVHHDA